MCRPLRDRITLDVEARDEGSPFADKLGDDARGTINFDRLDAYVRRYNFNGDVIWTHQFGSGVFDIVAALATDATSVYASWRYELRDRPGSDVAKGEQFPRVIGLLTLLCSHYKIGLLLKFSLIIFCK